MGRLGEKELNRCELLYTFDPDFPASLDTLLRPADVFGGVWTTTELLESRRLPRDVALFVNDMFGTRIASTHAPTAAPTVEVRLPSSWRALHETLKDELRPGTFVLVDRKKNNRVLKDFINAASADGVRVHVHASSMFTISSPPPPTTSRSGNSRAENSS